MTGLIVTPAPSVSPTRWSRLGWVAWRRYRATAFAAVGTLGAIAGYVLVKGLQLRSASAALRACTPPDAPQCRVLQDKLLAAGPTGVITVVLLLLPGAIGAFAGAPVLAREYETGTFYYTWTQGTGRLRWTSAMLAAGALGATLLALLFGLLISWYVQPLTVGGRRSPLDGQIFPITGIAVSGWALVGFALGVFAGLLWRRVVAGLATAFVAWFGLAFLAGSVLRNRYLPPLTSTAVPDDAILINESWTRNGVPVSDADVTAALPVDLKSVDPLAYLHDHGFTHLTSYQPDSRYWAFQWIEFGWLLLLSVVLVGAAWWWLRRRPL